VPFCRPQAAAAPSPWFPCDAALRTAHGPVADRLSVTLQDWEGADDVGVHVLSRRDGYVAEQSEGTVDCRFAPPSEELKMVRLHSKPHFEVIEPTNKAPSPVVGVAPLGPRAMSSRA
jgi:hypothetical protein